MSVMEGIFEENLVAYSLYDDNGDVYKIFIKEKEVASMDLDHMKRFRMLKQVKNVGQKPIEKWHNSLSVTHATSDMNNSEWKRPVSSRPNKVPSTKLSRKQKWSISDTATFLEICKLFREHLRCKQVPVEYWTQISIKLQSAGLHYSAAECRSKMKNLKYYFAHSSNPTWDHYGAMTFLFSTESIPDLNGRSGVNEGDNAVSIAPTEPETIDKAVIESPLAALELSGDKVVCGSTSGLAGLKKKWPQEDLMKGILDDPLLPIHDEASAEVVESADHSEMVEPVANQIVMVVPDGNTEKLAPQDHTDILAPQDHTQELTANCKTIGLHSIRENNVIILPLDMEGSDLGEDFTVHASYNMSLDLTGALSAALEQGALGDTEENNVDISSYNVSTRAITHASANMSLNDAEHVNSASDQLVTEFFLDEQDGNVDSDAFMSWPAEKHSACTAPGVITLSENDVSHLGVNVLPPDDCVLFSPKIEIISPDKNNNTPPVINIDSDSEDHNSPEVEQKGNIFNATVGQTTFYTNVASASTPRTPSPFGSPPKKRNTSGFTFRSPTNKTPKRKIAAVKLIWDARTTDAFVVACVTRKQDMQKDVVPLKVWKDIKAEMKEKGHNETWECYRAKFNQMNEYFANSLLRTGGKINGVMWPYYHQFCSIHDVPADFAPLDDAERTTAADVILTPSKKRRIWVLEAEKLLITLYADRKEKFDGTQSSIRHSTLYNEISSIMRANNVNVTTKQCKAHMTELLDEFRKAFDASRRTGEGAPDFRHYECMLKIFHGSATLYTPYSVSVGRGLKYTVNGSDKTESSCGTRTRPSFSAGDKAKKCCSGNKLKKPVFKSYSQELMEKQIELKEQQNEEFRLMREAFEKKSEERANMIKELVRMAALQMQANLGPKQT